MGSVIFKTNNLDWNKNSGKLSGSVQWNLDEEVS